MHILKKNQIATLNKNKFLPFPPLASHIRGMDTLAWEANQTLKNDLTFLVNYGLFCGELAPG